jgi:hypothetical protein
MRKIIVTNIKKMKMAWQIIPEIVVTGNIGNLTTEEYNYLLSSQPTYILCDRIDELYVEHKQEFQEFIKEKYPEEFI